MKNITLKLSIFSMILLSTILFSCKEEPPVRSGDGIRITNSSTLTYSNPDNYMDYLGEWHNDALDYIYTYHSAEIASNLSYAEIAEGMAAWMHQRQDIIVTAQDLESELIHVYDTTQIYVNYSKAILYDSLDLNATQINYMNQAFNIFSVVLTPSQDTLTYLEDLMDAFFDFEDDVLTDNTLDSSQKAIILITSSVLRHSFYYWNSHIDYLYDITSLSTNDNLKTKKVNPKLLGFWDDAWDAISFVAESDAVGAVAGGAGAAVGAFVLNVAPGAGQVAYGGAIAGGAVAGGVGNSIVDSYNKWAK